MVVSLVMDIILIVIAAIMIIRFARKGFVKTVLDLFKTVISIVLAVALRNPVAKLFDNLFMNRAIVGWVNKSLLQTASGDSGVMDFVSLYNDAPDFYNKVLSKFGINLEGLSEQMENFEGASEETISEMATNIGSSLSMLLSTALAVLVIFIVSIIVLSLVANLLNLLTKFAFLNALNKLLGVVAGVAMSFVVLWGISFLIQKGITLLNPLKPEVINQTIIDNSVILKFMCNYNLIDTIMGWFK